MSKFEKKACPECGKMVSSHPRWWKEHMESHATTPEVKEVIVEEKEVTVKEEPKVKSDKPKLSAANLELVEIARRKQAEMLEAPEIMVSENSVNEHMEARKVYAPETLADPANGRTFIRDRHGNITKKPTHHPYVADPDELKLAVQRGYEPVQDGHGEFVTAVGGGVLCTCPIEFAEARNDAQVAESERRLNISRDPKNTKSTTGQRDASGGKSDALGDFDTAGLKIEHSETQITTG